MTLKKQAIGGAKWTTASMLLVTGLQFAQVAVLARFLAPDDFGLMAVMMVVIGFSQAFQDMGISNAIIQRQEISHSQLSSLYWLNVASGAALSLVVLAISPLVAVFYDEPRITKLIAILSIVFILVAIGNQYRVLCQKSMDFRTMETINIFAAASALVVAIILATNDFGVLTLVISMLTQAGVASALFLWTGLRRYHIPSLTYRHSELVGFYGFGLYQMGERSINYISANADKLLLGKIVGMDATGFYNLAWQLVIFPLAKINPIVNKIAFPVYSKVQNDAAALNRYYTFSIKMLSLVTMPLLAFLFFFAHDVVEVVFGEGWIATAELLPALALVGILKAIGNPGGAIILALGRADIGFWWNVVWATSVVIALTIGLVMFPSAHTAVYILLALSLTLGMCWHILIAKVAKIFYFPIVTYFLKIFSVVMAIGWLGLVIVDMGRLTTPLLRVITGAILCGFIYLVYILIFERQFLSMLKSKN